MNNLEEKAEYFSKDSLKYFFFDYKLRNPALIFFYMIISLGLYFVTWMYQINKKLEEIDEKAPASNRAAFVLVILPLIWYFIVYFLELYTTTGANFLSNLIPQMVKVFGWGIISFLSLMYVYDFCISFGKVTQTSGVLWYIVIYMGYFSLILTIILGFHFFVYTFYFLFFPIIAIPAMQEMLNVRATRFTKETQKSYFNYMERKN
ncbi:MAG: hypothetical protein VXZ40_02055 [Nanoarchaeota archaeon]|nr:hypothetical protein [Nanoarchaeota archaeon]